MPRTTLTQTSDPPAQRADSWRTLGVFLAARFALNLQFRIVYPFLPAIGRGLGVPLETVSLLLTARALAAAASPLSGILADRIGRRSIMLAGLGALVAGALLVAVAPGFGAALVAFAVLGLGKASYDPAVQAYIGDAVPYERRGRVLGILEVSWALAWLVGVPGSGFLIAAYGWRAPFWAIAALGALSLLATWLLTPTVGVTAESRKSSASELAPRRVGTPHLDSRLQPVSRRRIPDRLKALVRTAAKRFSEQGRTPGQGDGTSDAAAVRSQPERLSWAAGLALAVSLLLILANENIFVVYGAWMEQQFGLSVSAVGVASAAIVVAELIAEGTSAGIVDRLGKRRAVLVGLALNALTYLLLPRLAGSLGGALLGVSLMILTFEFSIVSMVPLVSELAPSARGTLMSLNVAAMAAGRMISSLSGPRLWAAGGLPLNAVVSAAAAGLAAVVLWVGVKENGTTPPRPPPAPASPPPCAPTALR